MNKNRLMNTLLFLATILVLNACTGNELAPNNATQTGAVTGAIAGSIIGYNTGHGKGTNAVIGGLLGAGLGAGIGNAVDQNNPPQQNNGGWQ